MTKVTLKYINGNIPENLADILSNADEQDMRILIALMMAADGNGEVNTEFSLSDTLGLEKPEIDASLKFWRGAGVISAARSQKSVKSKTEKPESAEEPKTSAPTAHRDGAVEKSTGVSPYATDELAALFEKRRVTAQFIDEAQRVVGRTFNSYDTGIVAGLVDQLGFEEEAVLAILAYATRIGKKGLRYPEKLALSFYDEGITTESAVVARIAIIEHSAEVVGKIKQLFGMGSRELSRTEKTLFDKWTQKFGYGIEVIRVAYDITVDATQKPLPKYADAILEKWHAEGLRTEGEVLAFEQKSKPSKDSGEGEKSYELDDFFEAALKRSLEDLK
ncbi:MAG: DnaD domain protein [Clostridia bacterium]|nr:DnaD domain protein [Clostridia bacterium]